MKVRVEFLCISAVVEDAAMAMVYIEKVQLVHSAADTVCEKQHVPFEPGN